MAAAHPTPTPRLCSRCFSDHKFIVTAAPSDLPIYERDLYRYQASRLAQAFAHRKPASQRRHRSQFFRPFASCLRWGSPPARSPTNLQILLHRTHHQPASRFTRPPTHQLTFDTFLADCAPRRLTFAWRLQLPISPLAKRQNRARTRSSSRPATSLPGPTSRPEQALVTAEL